MPLAMDYTSFIVGTVAGVAAVTLDVTARDCECAVGGFVLGGAMRGLYILFKYGLRLNHWIQWPANAHDRLNTTLKYLGGSLGFTAAGAILALKIQKFVDMTNSESVWVVIGSASAIVGTWLLCRYTPYEPRLFSKKHAAWPFHYGVVGSLVALLIPSSRAHFMDAAGLLTVSIVGAYAAYAINLPVLAINWGGRLKFGLGMFTVTSLGACFTPFDNPLRSVFKSLSVASGLAVFSAYIMHHTQKLLTKAAITPVDAPFDPINE